MGVSSVETGTEVVNGEMARERMQGGKSTLGPWLNPGD